MKTYLFIIGLFLINSCRNESASNSLGFPKVVSTDAYRDCYNAVGFFRVTKEHVNNRLPEGFTAKDGASIMGPDYNGYAFIVLIYFACPGEKTSLQTAIIATPIEEPELSSDLRSVRWNWYEFARLTDSKNKSDELSAVGFASQHTTFSHTPIHEGDTTAVFEGIGNSSLFKVATHLTDSVNFEAQSHRFWHVDANGHLLTTRLDFDDHHSWIGKFTECTFDPAELTVVNLDGIECTGVGITEAIETINFKVQMMRWK
jgi:hypothetical protein